MKFSINNWKCESKLTEINHFLINSLKYSKSNLSNCIFTFARSGEVEGLVRGEESHEHWHLLNSDHAGVSHIEVSPGSGEVILEVLGLLGSLKSLVGLENFSGSSSGLSLSHEELSVGGSILVLSLLGVGHDHGFHEKIIGSSGKVLRDNSLVLVVNRSGSVLSGLEELGGVVNFLLLILGDLEEFLVAWDKREGMGSSDESSDSNGVFHFYN